MSGPLDRLEEARQDLELSVEDLWYRYFAIGGMSTALEIEAILYGALVGTHHDRDLITVALNERFAELDRDHPLPYSTDQSER